MSIAAAAAVMASGLIVGGSSASLAFAEPVKPPAGEDAGAGAGGGQQDIPPGSLPGSGAVTPALSTTTPGPVGKPGSPGELKQPRSHVGNGRTGVPSGTPGSAVDQTPPSERPDVNPPLGQQPPGEQPGELSEADGKLPEDGGKNTSGDDAAKRGQGSEHGGADPLGSSARGPLDVGPAAATEVPEGGEKNPKDPENPENPENPKGDEEGGEEGAEESDWCWWPFPSNPGLPDIDIDIGIGIDIGGDSDPAPPKIPVGATLSVPRMQIPPAQLQLPQLRAQLLAPELVPALTQPIQPLVDVVAGLATAATELPFTTITLPVIVLPGGAAGAPGGGGGAGAGGVGGTGRGPRPGMPESPRITDKPGGKPASPPSPAQNSPNPPAFAAGAGAAPAPAYRAGYTDYLRAAGLGQIAAVAVPGVTGILALVGAGGLLGYRQARAGHAVRANGPGRFMT